MPALGFLKRFERDVRLGVKRQTCRLPRRFPIEIGDTLHLFVGMRTRVCRKIGVALCVWVERVVITRDTLHVSGMRRYDLDSFAIADGFETWREFVDTLEQLHGLPFKGDVITWSRPRPPPRSSKQPRTGPTP